MLKAIGKFWSAVLVMSLSVVGVVAIPAEQEPAEALNGSMFNPGLIISDSVFYDFGTMTVADIQRFLDGRLSACRAAADRPGCLKDYRLSHPGATGSPGRCESLPAKNNISAAELIYDVARACGINPRVILVKLQKEQGLITSTDPSPRAYDFALGMDCPDTPSGCSAASAGFFWQLYKGAGQLNYYSNPAGPFTWLKVGSTVSILYQAGRPECGRQQFVLQNKATAALYYYTPYVPNQAALTNLYGLGDRCSAYGNRNFWRFFSDWFGSPIGGGFLLKAAKGDTFLIVDEVKYRVPDEELLASLAPLGPIGEISRDYLDSFTTVGDITPLVKNGNNDNYFFVDEGKRVRFESCEQVANFGLNCGSAVSLTGPQLTALAPGGDVTSVVVGASNEKYLVQAGTLREILNDASAAEASVPFIGTPTIRRAAVNYLPVGKPIASNGSLIANRETGELGIIAQESFFPIDKNTATDVNFGVWFQSTGSTLSSQSIEALTQGSVIQSIVADASGQQYLMTPTGKRLIEDTATWIESPSVLPDSVLALIPTATEKLVTPAVVRSTTNATLFLVNDGQLRPIEKSDRKAVKASLPDPTVHRISPSAITQMQKGIQVIPPGALVRLPNNRLFLVDGLDRAYRIPSTTQAQALGLGASRSVTKKALSPYKRSGKLAGVRVTCNAEPHIVVSGKLVRVSTETFAEYPTKSRALDAGTCAALKVNNAAGSRFIQTPDKKFFLVEDGKKRPIKNKKQYNALRDGGPKFVAVDNTFASRLKTGEPVQTGTAAVRDEVSAAPVVAPAPVRTTPTPTPTPTRTPAVATTPAPAPATSSATSYTIKSGDTLSGIAARFGTTTRKLMNLNNITDANRIRIGQVLRLPGAPSEPSEPEPAPAPSARTYTIKSGDSLSGIAARFGTTTRKLMNLNDIANADRIRIGDVLKLP
ncbi:MAG: LysM peptidoglycan-binding domain-containing protein [Rhodoluna sp.]